MTDERLEELEQYFLLDNSCEVGLELIAEVRRLRTLCDRIASDRIDESDLAQEAVRRERESAARTTGLAAVTGGGSGLVAVRP